MRITRGIVVILHKLHCSVRVDLRRPTVASHWRVSVPTSICTSGYLYLRVSVLTIAYCEWSCTRPSIKTVSAVMLHRVVLAVLYRFRISYFGEFSILCVADRIVKILNPFVFLGGATFKSLPGVKRILLSSFLTSSFTNQSG